MSKRYGYEHRRRRKQVARSVEAGLAHCARCGLPIEAGSLWDLGHNDLGPGTRGRSIVGVIGRRLVAVGRRRWRPGR
jgi:hypothetical protein